jgi:prefoldin subunit 5
MPDHQNQELIEARMNIVRLESQVEHLTAAFAKIEANQEAMAEKLDTVIQTLHQAQGGWKTLMLVGGAASTLGAGLTWIWAHLPRITA